ncbi:MAG: FHA domain-containing protein [Pyrinomonadaceae bacterium]
MPSAQLIVSQPGHGTRKLDVSGALVSIGRKSDNTLCLASDSNVSKYHAVIESRGGEFWLSDLGSSNGTTVNDAAVKAERQLADGDLICFGGTSTIEFRLSMAEGQQTSDGTASASAAPAAAGSVQSPSTPASADVASPSAVAPSPPPPAQKPGALSPAIIAAVVLGGLVVTGVLVAVLYGTGVLGGKSGASAATPTPTVAQNSEDEDETGEAEATPTPFEEMIFEETPALAPTPPVSAPGIPAASTDATAMYANTLVAQISQKNRYKFDPAFVALINKYTGEYRSANGYYERAGKYREAIDREFMNAQGIQPPLLGYVMAMSLTKFVDKGDGSGVWALPSAVLNEAGTTNATADPTAATRRAAAYIKELLDIFSKEEFVYVVACYGMTLQEAGKFNDELEKNDPGGQNRYDFWKMKNAGVVSGEQAERVARFFAAGIVGENPKEFGLPADGRLSSLY